MSPQRALPEPLRAVLRRLPTGPGVYLMKNASGRVLYVGKADALRNRVRSYFAERGPEDARIARMVTEVADVDYIVTDTVSEAYLLESNLIKEHRPRFNIRLRDDKSYPFVKITLGEDFPRIVRTRRLVRDGSRYFGPYASASSVDETLKLLRKIFPFRSCNLDIPEGKRVLDRPDRRLPRWQAGAHRGTAPPRDGCQRRSAALRGCGRRPRQAPRRRADDGAAEDGGLQPGRARRHRHGAGGGRCLFPGHAGPERQAHRPRALHRRGRPRRHRGRGARLLPSAVLRQHRCHSTCRPGA